MTVSILSLFPEVFEPYLKTSIIGRSIRENKINVSLVNFRDFATDKHKRVDDTTYGGGPGMVLKCDPLYRAIKSIHTRQSKLIFLTPEGTLFDQKQAQNLVQEQELIFVCGHYEGFDHRIFELFDHEKISIGDYILTGGELPALVILDSIIRLYKRVLNNPDSLVEESFNDGLLEYNQYTKPAEYCRLKVPEVLLNGHHKNIAMWRRRSSLINTLENRPDLIENSILTEEDLYFLTSFIEEEINDNK